LKKNENKVNYHNEKHPKKKITIESAKAGSMWPWSLSIFSFVNWALLRFTDEDYNMDKDIKNSLLMAKKCHYCMSKLPSYMSTKCKLYF
jgi:hypothetical protein